MEEKNEEEKKSRWTPDASLLFLYHSLDLPAKSATALRLCQTKSQSSSNSHATVLAVSTARLPFLLSLRLLSPGRASTTQKQEERSAESPYEHRIRELCRVALARAVRVSLILD